MKDLTEIKEKLQKLIAKEESARKLGSLEEAEAFAAKIAQLLLAYELDIQDIKNNPEETQVGDQIFDTEGLTGSHEANWVNYLYIACDSACFCQAVHYLGKPGQKTSYKVMIFGTAPNREFLHFMVAQLVVKLRELSRLAFKNYSGKDKRNTFIRSFLKGATDGIKTRLKLDSLHKQQMNTQVAGLVHNKNQAIVNYQRANGFYFEAHKRRNPGSTDGFIQGREAGLKVPINKGVGTSSKGPLLLK